MLKRFLIKTSAPFILVLLVPIISLGYFLARRVESTQVKTASATLLADARLLSGLTEQMTSPTGTSNTKERNQLLEDWHNILNARITLCTSAGEVIADSNLDPSTIPNLQNQAEIMQALANGDGVSIRYDETTGSKTLFAAVSRQSHAGTINIIRLARPYDQIISSINTIRQIIFGACLLISALAVFVVSGISSKTSEQIRKLAQAARQLNTATSGDKIPAHEYHGVEHTLAETINTITENLKNKLSALQTDREKLSAILQQMTDGVLIVDEQGIVTLMNRAAESMFGVTIENWRQPSVAEVLRHYELINLWQTCHDSGSKESSAIELTLQQKFIQSIAIPLGDSLNGQILLLFQDLTRIRHLETVRRDFVSNISHELRTPLASLKALTETLQAGALEDPPAARRFLDRMVTEVDALSHMVSELLELTRIESGQVPFQFAPVSPQGLITSAVERLIVQAQRVGLEIEVDIHDGNEKVRADKPRLEQVLVNLIHNAIKFTPPPGKITISTRKKGQTILFSIQDTGIGIPADDLPRVFERFYKTDRARTGGGTGLGLAISRHIIEAHNGVIWVESTEGEGSTFLFTIPLAKLSEES